MKLVAEMGYQLLEKPVSNRRTIRDFREIYGGEIKDFQNPASPTRRKDSSFTSDDRAFFASRPRIRGAKTVITHKGLNEQKQAMRWTALEAYKAKAGVTLTSLAVEIPGVRAAWEWNARQITANTGKQPDFVIVPSTPEGGSAFEKVFELARQMRVDYFNNMHASLDTMSGLNIDPQGLTPSDYALRAKAIMDGLSTLNEGNFEDDPNSVSRMIIGGQEGLVPIVDRLSSEYDELLSRDVNEDPATVVAKAFGAATLDTLNAAWGYAMKAKSPKSASLSIIDALSQNS